MLANCQDCYVRDNIDSCVITYSPQITNNQHRIIMILKSLGIQMDLVDISAPGMEDQRDAMRASAKKKEGQRHALPPQIFNGDKYCGVSCKHCS